jgi:hypothetical protein
MPNVWCSAQIRNAYVCVHNSAIACCAWVEQQLSHLTVCRARRPAMIYWEGRQGGQTAWEARQPSEGIWDEAGNKLLMIGWRLRLLTQ